MFTELLKKLAQKLTSAGIPYMVFGGQAVLLHGEFRVTQDIDVTLGVEPAEAAPVLAVIEQLGLQILVSDVHDFLRQTFVLPARDPKTGIRIDFVFSLSQFERAAIERAVTVAYDGVEVRFASVEDLIIQKIVAGRPRDLADAKTVILKNPKYDRNYVERWLQQLDQELDTKFLLTYEQLASRRV
jgi:hypothetical protein